MRYKYHCLKCGINTNDVEIIHDITDEKSNIISIGSKGQKVHVIRSFPYAQTCGRVVRLPQNKEYFQKVLRKIHKTQPDEYFTEHIPDIFDYETVLYIGIEQYRAVMLKNFLIHNYTIDIIEIWKPHAEYWNGVNNRLKSFRNVIHADIRDIDKARFPLFKYDVVMWFHGPEHIKKSELKSTTEKLKTITEKLLVYACPYGLTKSKARGGNAFNEHVSGLYQTDFIDLGMETVGSKKDKRIKSWWRNK